ncbi:hypothetical protein I4U23_016344 [Adineta vaga]|nr:hypothetical protein I4U23_016344 [Adineta vaga]
MFLHTLVFASIITIFQHSVDSKNFIWRISYGINGNPTYCGGYWLQTGMHTFRETITYGSCVNGFSSLTSIENGLNAYT